FDHYSQFLGHGFPPGVARAATALAGGGRDQLMVRPVAASASQPSISASSVASASSGVLPTGFMPTANRRSLMVASAPAAAMAALSLSTIASGVASGTK